MVPGSAPEVWLRGPVPGFEPLLMPAVHALLQAREDLERVEHLAGSLDRLLTYARGESLSEAQRRMLAEEGTPAAPASVLVPAACTAIDRALEQLRNTPSETLLESRAVGRARLPTTVLGLVFHAAEHTTRHAGQLITTLKVVRGPGSGEERRRAI